MPLWVRQGLGPQMWGLTAPEREGHWLQANSCYAVVPESAPPLHLGSLSQSRVT